MAQTASNMLPLGTKAPDFRLLDTVSGKKRSLDACKGLKGTVIMFICNHCPYVKHVNARLSKLAKEYKSKGIEFIAISSNDVVSYPQDGPDLMKKNAIDEGFIFPYLYDQTQSIAKAYSAACTPDFYLFDANLELFYRGQLDSSRPSNEIPVTGEDLSNALNLLLNNQQPPQDQKPSLGCNIKWRNENKHVGQ
ncbi:thioredoxin family protein [Gelidibacter salicanalis]|uniref:Thioredoxin family protein n=1 Tax=Gelidibacter salicanalis TaxID=291193 RepID=A0A934NIJ5_9FLAO|nr:thioredoxin family protein [Gelidibacter salicanalis]MBJ7881233.1 thioredoxin family protein [Gelidibacter salicanalis]